MESGLRGAPADQSILDMLFISDNRSSIRKLDTSNHLPYPLESFELDPVLAGVQAQAEYEGQDGVPGGTSPSIGRPEAHRGNGRLHSYTRFDYISSNDAKGYNSGGASYQEL